MRTALVAACVAMACGAPQRPARAPGPAYAVKTYEPLAFKADATVPQHAVVLGTDARGGSTLVPLVATGKAVVDGLTLVTAANLDGALHVTISDPAASAALRANVWRAALAAATTLDKNLTDFTFAVTTAGPRPTPPDASALAAGFVSALTGGAQLPATVPVEEADMALDEPTAKALETKYTQWQARLAVEWGAILQLESAGRVPALVVRMRDAAKRDAAAAEQLHKQHADAAAYARMREAAVHARTANLIYDVLSNVQNNKLDAAVAVLDKLANLDDATKSAFARIAALQPPTLGSHLQMIAASRAALRARAFASVATRALAMSKAHIKALAGSDAATLGSDRVADEVVALAGPAILYAARATAETTVATDQLDLANAADVPYTASAPDVLRLASALLATGAAALAAVEADNRRADDAELAVVQTAVKLADDRELRDTWGAESLAWALLSFAAGDLALSETAQLLAEHDPKGDKALASTLSAAEREARASARAARVATGAIPVQARLAYQLASTEKTGTPSERLDALAQYRTATAFAQAAVMLARN